MSEKDPAEKTPDIEDYQDEQAATGAAFWEKLLPFFTLAALVILLLIFSDPFQSSPLSNSKTVLVRASVFIIAAAGMTMVIVSGGIDLSVGSVMAFSGVAGAMVARSCAGAFGAEPGWTAALIGLIAGISAGAFAGLLNGLAICFLRVPPFIATLGALGIFRGAAELLSGKLPISDQPEAYAMFWNRMLSGWVPIVPVVLVVAFFTYLMRYTLLGRYTYAIGSNSQAAKLSGVKITRHLLKIYTINGALAGLAGMMLVMKLNSGDPGSAIGYELFVIAGVVIGGGSLAGGAGTIIGTLIGTIIMQLLKHGCILLGVETSWQPVIIGLIVIAAVAFDQYRRRARAS